MSLIRDYPDYRFTAPNGVASRCRIRLYAVQGESAKQMPAAFHRNCIVVIATQLEEDDVGMSVTSAAETIATKVVAESAIDPMRLIWIEHYQERGTKTEPFHESFDRVLFDTHHNPSYGTTAALHRRGPWILRRPVWTHRIPREFIEQLIGEPIQ